MKISINNDPETIEASLNLLSLAGFSESSGRKNEDLTLLDSFRRLPSLSVVFANVAAIQDGLQGRDIDMGFIKKYDMVEYGGYNIEQRVRTIQRFNACSLPLVLAKREDIAIDFDDNRYELENYVVGTTNPRYFEGWASKFFIDPNVVTITDEDLSMYGPNIMKAKKLDLIAFAKTGTSCRDLGLNYDQTIANPSLELYGSSRPPTIEQILFAERLVVAERSQSTPRSGQKNQCFDDSYFPTQSYGLKFD